MGNSQGTDSVFSDKNEFRDVVPERKTAEHHGWQYMNMPGMLVFEVNELFYSVFQFTDVATLILLVRV